MGALLLVYGSWQLLRWGPSSERHVIGDLFFYPVSGAAVWTAWQASRRCVASRRLRRAWRFLALAALAYLLGDIAQTVYELLGRRPYPSIADGLYLAFYPLMLVGLLSFAVRERGRANRIRLGLDLGVVTLGGAGLVIYAVLGPTAVADGGGALQAVFSIAYPVGDMVLFVGLASVLLRGAAPSARHALLVMAVGLLFFVVSDLIYGYITLHSTYQGGDPVDTLWMVAIAFFAVAGSAQEAVSGGEEIRVVRERVGSLPYVAVAFTFGLLIFTDRHEDLFAGGLALTLIAVVVAGLVSIRQFLGQRDLLATQAVLAGALAAEQAARAETTAALAQVEEANKHARSSFDGAVIGMMLVDASGVLLAANQSCAAMLGRAPSELVGMRGLDLVHPDDRALLLASRERRLAATTEHTELELRHVRKNGAVMTGHYTISPIRAEDGSLLHQLVEMEDVTELRRIETDLADARALQEAVIEVSNDVLSVIEPDGTIRLVSHAVEDSLGYTESELLGTNFLSLVHADDRQAAQEQMAAAMRGEMTAPLRFRVVARDGRERLWEGSVAAERYSGRPPAFLVANLRDITDRVALEEQFRQSQKMETVGRLAGGVAHDFNNLLVGIHGYSELALLKVGDGPGSTEIAGSIAAAEKAAELTAQLLAYSRRQVLAPGVFDLRDVVEEMTGLLHRLINSTIELVTSLPERPALIYADRSQIEQVLMNLAVNARDAMPAGGRLTIEVTVHDDQGCVELVVADNGVGIESTTAAQIFDPFFTTKDQAGTGLGLSTVQGIIIQSGGEISVESEPDDGAAFTIRLPLVTDDDARVRTKPEPPARHETQHGKTVLLVEDEQVVRDVLAQMLTERGYSVSVAASGEEGVALAQCIGLGHLDVVVTDLVMAGLNGRETADAIRTHHPNTKTLYISGYTEDEAVRIGGYEPGIAFLRKPFSTDQIDVKIRELLNAVTSEPAS